MCMMQVANVIKMAARESRPVRNIFEITFDNSDISDSDDDFEIPHDDSEDSSESDADLDSSVHSLRDIDEPRPGVSGDTSASVLVDSSELGDTSDDD